MWNIINAVRNRFRRGAPAYLKSPVIALLHISDLTVGTTGDHIDNFNVMGLLGFHNSKDRRAALNHQRYFGVLDISSHSLGCLIKILVSSPMMKSGPVFSQMEHCSFSSMDIDQILIYQQTELLEAVTGFESANKYKIENSHGQKVYYAVEYTNFCTRNCCGAYRPFTMRIFDNVGQEVITLKRPLRCSSCCFPCCLQKIEIQAPPGVPIGFVSQTCHPCLPKFTVQNGNREEVLKIIGPFILCSCGADIDFEITSLDEQTVVGKISKHWSGFVRELLTDTDFFRIQFPLDLEVNMKAVMLGACFLIDFMFFETTASMKIHLGMW
uniref:phospholipid scramblase 2-like n=1 Tax=Jaculus jaculus TaxID=51337 RepID=UPI001E1AFC04|nr:phospholipid scramblase 2-like [Jaculus jaculus]